MFDVALANWVGRAAACACTPRRAASRSRSSTPATCTPATTSWSRDYKLGNIREHAHGRAGRLPAAAAISGWTSATRCRSTAWTATCASPATAAAQGPLRRRRRTASPGLNYLCAGLQAFFHHIDEPMRTMGRLLAAGRAPVRDRDAYATPDAQRGRNEPCTCGSGRKWKQCHAQGQATAATSRPDRRARPGSVPASPAAGCGLRAAARNALRSRRRPGPLDSPPGGPGRPSSWTIEKASISAHRYPARSGPAQRTGRLIPTRNSTVARNTVSRTYLSPRRPGLRAAAKARVRRRASSPRLLEGSRTAACREAPGRRPALVAGSVASQAWNAGR